MARERSLPDRDRRSVLKISGAVGLVSLFGASIVGADQHDDREALNSRFETLVDEYGSPTVVGRKRFVNERLVLDTGGPNLSQGTSVLSEANLASAERIRFGDHLERDVLIARRGNGVFLVQFEDEIYRLHLTPTDERRIGRKLSRIDAKIDEEIRRKARERFAVKGESASEGT